ncbi:MAG: ATP-binding protein [Lentisphaeria bacterium]
MKKKVLLSWSSGKDSAWALKVLNESPNYQVVGLFTTVNEKFERVAMHAVRENLLKQQAQAVGLPLKILYIPFPCSNEQYEQVMKNYISEVENDDIEIMAFGDLFLNDVRNYREEKLKNTKITPIFPLWGSNTSTLAIEMIDAGVKTTLTCVDSRKLDPTFSGQFFSKELINKLPNDVDPCGENGEFHTFVSDGPMFHYPLKIKLGDTINRDGYIFTDILPI